jgi:hypothetical protein
LVSNEDATQSIASRGTQRFERPPKIIHRGRLKLSMASR